MNTKNNEFFRVPNIDWTAARGAIKSFMVVLKRMCKLAREIKRGPGEPPR